MVEICYMVENLRWKLSLAARETRAELGLELCKRVVPGAVSEQTGARDNIEIMGLGGRILFFPLLQKTKHTLLINLRSSTLCYLKAAIV